MACWRCGAEQNPDGIFCPNCGAKLSQQQNTLQSYNLKTGKTSTNNSLAKYLLSGILIALILASMLFGYYILKNPDFCDRTEQIEHAASPAQTEPRQPEIQKQYNRLTDVKVGDCICFGTYEQDNNPGNGNEEIEWLVLSKERDRILVVSVYALDIQRYNDTYESTTWETCSLRAWLNYSFYETAFGNEEKALVMETEVLAEKNPSFKTNPGNSTRDRVFLLSIPEVNKYMDQKTAMCFPTKTAKATETMPNVQDNAVWWWLRSPGLFSETAAFVYNLGVISGDGSSVDWDGVYVRPAMYLSIS